MIHNAAMQTVVLHNKYSEKRKMLEGQRTHKKTVQISLSKLHIHLHTQWQYFSNLSLLQVLTMCAPVFAPSVFTHTRTHTYAAMLKHERHRCTQGCIYDTHTHLWCVCVCPPHTHTHASLRVSLPSARLARYRNLTNVTTTSPDTVPATRTWTLAGYVHSAQEKQHISQNIWWKRYGWHGGTLL